MKVTVFRTKKDTPGETIQNVEFDDLIVKIGHDLSNGYITKFREVNKYLDEPEHYNNYKYIPLVCPVAEYSQSKEGERKMKRYNGISVLKIQDLANILEMEEAKKRCEMLPQVLCAFMGVDAQSLIVLTMATLPDGTLPKGEAEAELFATKAYVTSVLCLQPLVRKTIQMEQPKLDTAFKMTVDENPYVNQHPTPFIIEQPTEMDINQLIDDQETDKALSKMMPGPETYLTFARVFHVAYSRAIQSINWKKTDNPIDLVAMIAEECVRVGLPQEEVTNRIAFRFHTLAEDEVRGIVKDTYETNEGTKICLPMTKHQFAAYKLREFLQRRYEIRFNEILQMTEFRERHSFRFLFRELSKRELNTIHHEALLEGVEATAGEVDELVHSTRTKNFNPKEEYLSKLAKWDGKDHIAKLAKMVPTDNPYWERLFKQWFLSMVAHWMNGDEAHANSTAPILIGPQGYRKSTFCRLILPPELRTFYNDSIDFRTNIEAERSLSRFLLVNIDEFDQLSEKQFAFVKHLFQKPASSIRRMYSEAIATQRRYASFIGTTNSDEVLRDPTGNRRYLCVSVTDYIRTDEPIDYAQLYAQAVAQITRGDRYWINDEDEKLIKETNQQFEVHSPLESLFLTCFQQMAETEEGGEWLRPTEIMAELQTLPAFNRKKYNDLQGLGKVLTKLRLAKRRYSTGMQYYVKRVGE